MLTTGGLCGPSSQNRWRLAWAGLTAAFVLHVVDEATHGFLAWYNPSALALRERLGCIPFPMIFSRPVWLVGLLVAVAILAAMTPFIRPGRRWVAVAAYAYGIVHVANAGAHVVVSLLP